MASRAARSRRLTAAPVLVAALALVALAGLTLVSRGKKASPTELVLPWYETASVGDGLGPEAVSTWAIPPPVSFVHPSAGTTQDPTKWNGDHALNGGNKEWAEEDAALHAYNMENWRNKILETQLGRQKMQYSMMNIGSSSSSKARSWPSVLSSTTTETKTKSKGDSSKSSTSTSSSSAKAASVKKGAAGVESAVKEFEAWIGKFEGKVQEHMQLKKGEKPDTAELSRMKKWFKRRVLRTLGATPPPATKVVDNSGQIRELKAWLKRKLRRLRRARRAAAASGAAKCGKNGCADQNSGVYFANNRISGNARVWVYPPGYGAAKVKTAAGSGAGHKKTEAEKQKEAEEKKKKAAAAGAKSKKFGGPMSLGQETQAVFDHAIAKIAALEPEGSETAYTRDDYYRGDADTEDPRSESHEAALLRKVMRKLKTDEPGPSASLRQRVVADAEEKESKIANMQRLVRDIKAIKTLKSRLQ